MHVLDQQRKLLHEMNRLLEFDEDLVRKYLSLLDLEEYKSWKNCKNKLDKSRSKSYVR